MTTCTYEGILAATEYNTQASQLLFYIFESSILSLILHPCTLLIITNSKQGRQLTYKRNIGAHSRNHYCRGKALSITYSECVSVSLVTSIQNACTLLYCYLCPLRLHHIFPQYLINRTTLEKKKFLNIKHVFWFFSTTVVRNIFHSKRKWVRYCHKCM
jgi:hypothetical protein